MHECTAAVQDSGRLVSGLPFGQVGAVGLHFPLAQKVAELGPQYPGGVLHDWTPVWLLCRRTSGS